MEEEENISDEVEYCHESSSMRGRHDYYHDQINPFDDAPGPHHSGMHDM
eukprot:CAMPEP_0170558916 /NCGR_PEP_ID=MMETSP0211-20121228/38946_1 /TAXON_ID=311385 /ORGANISM="Pseudokeronopsis sp., Strain OXSARD2" /LENGTH=48 /DNA_ID= /DNA_START= /DNA_END= /DNA_ORIENTATION=